MGRTNDNGTLWSLTNIFFMDKNFIGVTFNNYKVVVNNAKKVSGHDDTLPFNADFEVYKDGNLFFDGKAWNDGWGGPSCLSYDKKITNKRRRNLTMYVSLFSLGNLPLGRGNLKCQRNL